jgi:hypothetical protein
LKSEDTERALRLLIEQSGLDPDAVKMAASRIPFTG